MFKDKLKQVMDEKNLTLTELSAATGIGKSSISQYLSGKNEPAEKRKTELAAALGLDADYFKKAAVKADIIAPDGAALDAKTAAKLMGKSKEFVYQGLRDGVFPWGYAVKLSSHWAYYISAVKFTECTGIQLHHE